MHVVSPRLGRGIQLQGARPLPELRRKTHGQRRRPPRRQGPSGGARAAQLAVLRSLNVSAEISAIVNVLSTDEEKHQFVSAIRAFGVQRVLFGSDWPAFHPAETLHALRTMGFSEREVRAFTKGNSARLLGSYFHDH